MLARLILAALAILLLSACSSPTEPAPESIAKRVPMCWYPGPDGRTIVCDPRPAAPVTP